MNLHENIQELERAGALRFQAERVSIPETKEKFIREAKSIEEQQSQKIKAHGEAKKPENKETKSKFSVPIKNISFKKIISKSLAGKLSSKKVISSPKIEVRVYQKPTGLQKMDRDKSRFFKTAWEEEKRSLFFQ